MKKLKKTKTLTKTASKNGPYLILQDVLNSFIVAVKLEKKYYDFFDNHELDMFLTFAKDVGYTLRRAFRGAF